LKATASESASPVNIIGFSFNLGSRHSPRRLRLRQND